MFLKLTPSLFVFAGLALRLRNRSLNTGLRVLKFKCGESSALIVTLGKGYAYLFSFVQENHFL